MASNITALVVTATMLVVIDPNLGAAVIVGLVPLGFASTIFQNRFRNAALTARKGAGE